MLVHQTLLIFFLVLNQFPTPTPTRATRAPTATAPALVGALRDTEARAIRRGVCGLGAVRSVVEGLGVRAEAEEECRTCGRGRRTGGSGRWGAGQDPEAVI